jgi:hypothetical protein
MTAGKISLLLGIDPCRLEIFIPNSVHKTLQQYPIHDALEFIIPIIYALTNTPIQLSLYLNVTERDCSQGSIASLPIPFCTCPKFDSILKVSLWMRYKGVAKKILSNIAIFTGSAIH